MGFLRQEYWSRLPFPSPGDLPDPGIEPAVTASAALAGGFCTTEPPGKPSEVAYKNINNMINDKSHGKLMAGETFSLFMGLRFHDFGREEGVK